MEQEPLFEENDIVNKEYYEGIKDMIKCSICLEIVKDPVQCDKCQHCFCSGCSREINNCPYRCESSKFVPSFICNQLLSELKIRCKCGKEINYDFLKNHKKKDCITDYKEKYLNLKKKYDLLVQGINRISDYKYCIMSSVHSHPIECNRRFLQTWYCDNCEKSFNDDVPSYQCTLCNFDLCYYCAKRTVIEGTVLDEMVEYYVNKPIDVLDIPSQFNVKSNLHMHPLAYVIIFNPWFCDNCNNEFEIGIPSFKCTLCDYDLCKDCAENTKKKTRIK